MSQAIIIPERFNGPLDSANGGYVCGVVSAMIEGDAEVTLRSPPPLETPLQVERGADGSVEILDDDTLVATGRSITFDPPVLPAIPSWDQAAAASQHYLGHERHEYATCFSCGPERDDGLGIFPGPTEMESVAATWIPDGSLPNRDGILPTPIVWAALDCPGAWATVRNLTKGQIVLGRMAAVVSQPIEIGRRYVAIAWSLATQGRKSFAATAIIDDTGEVVGSARQTWISLDRGEPQAG